MAQEKKDCLSIIKQVFPSVRVPPQTKPRTKHRLLEQIESSSYAGKGRKESDEITSNNGDKPQFDANDKYSPYKQEKDESQTSITRHCYCHSVYWLQI